MRACLGLVRLAAITAALLMRPAVLPAQSPLCVLDESQKLIPSDAGADDRVGSSVSISGNYAVVGAWRAEAAYVFRRSGDGTPLDAEDHSWVEEAKLTPSDGGGLFGWTVAISGDRAIVGARFNSSAAVRAGSAYVFRRDENGTPLSPEDDFWVEEAKLMASDAGNDDEFGTSVSIDGDRGIVGANFDDDGGASSGSAYVFRKDDNGTPLDPTDDFWVEEDKLTASDAVGGEEFGFSVAISGDQAVIGAWHDGDAGDRSGSAYVFRHSDNGTPADPSDDFWLEQDKLTALDAATFDNFGVSVAVSGDRAVVGSWLDDDAGSLSGSAYVFRRDEGLTPLDPSDDIWIQEAKLTASDAAAGDEFGKSVAISGDGVVVGAFEDDDACANDPEPDPNCDSGSAYVFRRDSNSTPSDPSDDSWLQVAKLTASDTGPKTFFGRAAIAGEQVLVGALDDEAGENSGAVYVFWVSGENPCAPPDEDVIPTISEWGMIAMTLLVLAAGTVVLRRQSAMD